MINHPTVCQSANLFSCLVPFLFYFGRLLILCCFTVLHSSISYLSDSSSFDLCSLFPGLWGVAFREALRMTFTPCELSISITGLSTIVHCFWYFHHGERCHRHMDYSKAVQLLALFSCLLGKPPAVIKPHMMIFAHLLNHWWLGWSGWNQQWGKAVHSPKNLTEINVLVIKVARFRRFHQSIYWLICNSWCWLILDTKWWTQSCPLLI